MSRIRLRLAPSWDETHTQMSTSLALPRPLRPWELTDLTCLLRACSGHQIGVALPADAPCEWLDEWCDVLAGPVAGGLEVDFLPGHRRRKRPF